MSAPIEWIPFCSRLNPSRRETIMNINSTVAVGFQIVAVKFCLCVAPKGIMANQISQIGPVDKTASADQPKVWFIFRSIGNMKNRRTFPAKLTSLKSRMLIKEHESFSKISMPDESFETKNLFEKENRD